MILLCLQCVLEKMLLQERQLNFLELHDKIWQVYLYPEYANFNTSDFTSVVDLTGYLSSVPISSSCANAAYDSCLTFTLEQGVTVLLSVPSTESLSSTSCDNTDSSASLSSSSFYDNSNYLSDDTSSEHSDVRSIDSATHITAASVCMFATLLALS